MDRGAWQATVLGVAKSQTQLKQLSTHEHVVLKSREKIKLAKNRALRLRNSAIIC